MTTRTEVRAIESQIKSMSNDKTEQITILSAAQGMTKDEHSIIVLVIVKNRIIHA